MTTVDRTNTCLRRRTVLALAVSAIGFAGAAHAQATTDLVGLMVVDRDTGQPLRVWRRNGRLFVAGQPGARYSLRLTNNTGGRVLVVMSVDGVNILTGETAVFDQRGYVFAPYESYDVSGWRKSDTQVAAFTFAPLSRSYAARTGRPNDVGVIGIAAFTERLYAPRAAAPAVVPQSLDDSGGEDVDEVVVTGSLLRSAPPAAVAAPSARPAPAPEARKSEKLGTGHGAREWSVVTTVPFERATASPQLVRRIEYDSTENLIALGVIPRPRPTPPAPPRPRPFPASPNGYVPDPPYGR